MEGVVSEINHDRGVIAIKTAEGYSLCELMEGSAVSIGDQVECERYPLGSAIITNRSTRQTLRVYFQGHGATEERAMDFAGP